MNKLKQNIVVVLSLWITFVSTLQQNHRSRRTLTFPSTTPARVQTILGIGIPVDLEFESVTIGYVFKVEFTVPDAASNYLNILGDPFDITPNPITGFLRKRRSIDNSSTEIAGNEIDKHSDDKGFDDQQNEGYERHTVQAEVVESGTEPNDPSEMDDEEMWFQGEKYDRRIDPMTPKEPQNLGTSRWAVYKGMAAIAESKGLVGKACVLRSICEAAHTPFDYSNGILGELMHVIMSPSSTRDQLSDYSDSEYYRAENLGKEGAPCERVFKECRTSILDQFSGIYTPMMDLLDTFIH